MRDLCALLLLVSQYALPLSGVTAKRWQPNKRATKTTTTTRAPVNNASNLRIQNGEDDTTGKYPYVVAVLQENKLRKCTGTLIAPTWVLTAAHCTAVSYVQYGDMSVSRDNITTISEILNFIPHPNYKALKYLPKSDIYNDIGLMLITEIKCEVVGKLSGLDYRSLFGYRVEYAGYGLTDTSNKNLLNDHEKPLQVANGMVSTCHDVQTQLFYYPKLCIAPECAKRQSMMPGDSGGPLFVDGKVVGINVAIIYDPKISICTPISPYISWIQKVMDNPG